MSTTSEGPADIQLDLVSSLQLDASIDPLSLALMDILKRRCTERAFSTAPLAPAQLSRMLWAACGCNRNSGALRTAPAPRQAGTIELYVAMANGLYLFNAPEMRLVRQSTQDVRHATGLHPSVADAPVSLVYVAEYSDAVSTAQVAAGLAIGHVSENVYLFCAAEGLAAYAHTDFDQAALAGAMGLNKEQHVMLAQSVGHPATPRTPAARRYDE